MQAMSTRISLALGLGALGLLAGCNPKANDNTSAVLMNANFSGDTNAGFFSDVVADTGTPADDFFDIQISTTAKSTINEPGDFYIVDLKSYQVFFTRSDGRNQPGIDVPFPVTLAIGGSIAPGGELTLHTLFVTEEMKRQAPLKDLWFSTNQRLFTTMHVHVFGEDRVGNAVSADAATTVIFGDF
jgi:hypothetical protein